MRIYKVTKPLLSSDPIFQALHECYDNNKDEFGKPDPIKHAMWEKYKCFVFVRFDKPFDGALMYEIPESDLIDCATFLKDNKQRDDNGNLTPRMAAEILHKSYETIRRMCRSGLIHCIPNAKNSYRIPKSEVERLKNGG